MKNRYDDLNKFLESIHMGSKITKIYKDKTESKEVVALLDEVIATFKKHEENVSEQISKHDVNPCEDLSVGKEMIVWMERMKNLKESFDVGIELLKAINMGTSKGLEFIYEHDDYDIETTKCLKDVIKDYSYLYTKVTNYITDKYI